MSPPALAPVAAAPYPWLASLRAVWPWLALAIAFRYACYAAMTALALWNELRPAPSLPDLLLEHVPYQAWIDRLNYVAWLGLYLPISAAFLVLLPRRWVRYMITGGLVSLARGLCIAATGLGPPDSAGAGAGLGGRGFWEAYLDLLSPIGVFAHGSARAYLTKDLFFSGHTATTFLLVLYLWDRPRLRWLALAAHLSMVATVLSAHMHYTIDVLGAWAFTFALYAAREWRPRAATASCAEGSLP